MKKFIIIITLCFYFIHLQSQVTPEQARNMVLTEYSSEIYSEYNIYQFSKIIPAGTKIQTVFDDTINVEHTAYLFFIDKKPYANWQHECIYLLLSERDSSISHVESQSPPKGLYSNYNLVKETDLSAPIKNIANMSNSLNTTSCSNNINKYAIIINGGIDAVHNNLRYWNDCSFIYKTLTETYGYSKNNIYVLMSDGTNPAVDINEGENQYISQDLDLDGDGEDDIEYVANKENITYVFNSLSNRMVAGDELFIFTIDHGGIANGNYVLCLWGENITSSEFATEVDKIRKDCFINIVMGQCKSGGFYNDLYAHNRVLSLATQPSENSYGYINSYDIFVHNITSALNGSNFYGDIVNADYDNNGVVTMSEAFSYAYENRYYLEHPIQESEPYFIKEKLTLCNIPCHNNENILTGEIADNTIISESTFGYDKIIITSGTILTITSTLKLAPGSKIIVEPGAKLVVNGGEIVGACGEYWNGIRLEGNKNLPQTESNQGVVELNNALISDAKDAISVIGENSDWNKTGGIIKAKNTTFKNNRRSIEFMSYGEGSNVNNVSYFRNCTFTWDDDLLANESTVQAHITMYQVRGVEVLGCTFKDERTSTTGLTTHGILTNQAGFIVNNYLLLPGHGGTAVYKNTSFENLTYGIRTEEADDKLCKVENSVFDENDKGIYVTNTDNLYVVNNTFNVKLMAHGMGLVAQNSTNFTIQKNDFLGTSNTNNLLATAGLQIVSSGEDDNLIKQNRFVNLYSGFQALGVNYGINTGLELNCNSFASCQRGIDIPAFPLNNVTGIKSVQGSQSLSAGNKFTNNTNNVINNGVNTITYYYYGTQENPNYFSMKFLPMQASSGASCGLIGNMTGPNFPLLSNGDGEENEEEESIETSSIAPTTVLSYINKKDYLSAENLLSTSDMSQEEKNDYRLYSSYIQEYGNSYNIPIDILLDLSGKENNIGLVAKQMLYFKGVEADLHPKVIVEQPQDSDTTTITNKMKSVKVLNGLSQNDEYTLSPNPANSEVVVKGAKEIREITILDLQGKELKSFYNTEKFNISFLKNGTYIVRIFDSGNKVHYQKLIKQ